jgi:hypothetical protein
MQPFFSSCNSLVDIPLCYFRSPYKAEFSNPGEEWSFAVRSCFWGDYSVRSRKIASLLICYARGGIPMQALCPGPQAPPPVPSICLPIYIPLSFVVNRKFINIRFFANESSTFILLTSFVLFHFKYLPIPHFQAVNQNTKIPPHALTLSTLLQEMATNSGDCNIVLYYFKPLDCPLQVFAMFIPFLSRVLVYIPSVQFMASTQ